MSLPFEAVLVVAVALSAVISLGIVVRSRYGRRKDREKLRRRLLEQQGRIVEGTLFDFKDGVAYYSWSWQGVVYESSQDLGPLLSGSRGDSDRVIGAVAVRFLAREPSNSIILSENWSGLGGYTRTQVLGASAPSSPINSHKTHP